MLRWLSLILGKDPANSIRRNWRLLTLSISQTSSRVRSFSYLELLIGCPFCKRLSRHDQRSLRDRLIETIEVNIKVGFIQIQKKR